MSPRTLQSRRRSHVFAWALPASVALHASLVAGVAIHQTPTKRTHELTDIVGEAPTVLELRRDDPPAEEVPEPIAMEAQEPVPEPEPVVADAPPPPLPRPDPLSSPAPALTTEPEPELPSMSRAASETVAEQVPQPAPAVATPPPSPAPPPPAPVLFAGVQAEPAETVVYVVDGSGPMASSLPFVFAELERSVRRLSPMQRFGVIVFRDPPQGAAGIAAVERYQPSGRLGLVEATDLHKAGLSAWLRTIRPSGRSDPVRGLRAALDLKPDLVMLLSRTIPRSGPGSETSAQIRHALAELDRLNPASRLTHQRPTVIKTIQFIDDDPSGLLQAIADAHGDGPHSYRLVTLDDLNAR